MALLNTFFRTARRQLMGVAAIVACTAFSTSASALVIGLNPASPLGGFDLGGGRYATLIGVQSSSTLVGTNITASALFGTIISGSVEGFYYAAGNAASAQFDDIDLYSPFVSDDVVAAGSRQDRIWDSLYAIHSGTVVFSNGTGGTATMSIGGTRRQDNPFEQVPEPGTIALLGLGLAGLAYRRRRAS